ncbi:hypothetical protein QQ045_007619 [Rhodiola kirilowii]
MSDKSPAPKQPIGTCKFYGSNFRSPRVYPSRKTILIDLPETDFIDDHPKSKHGAARWTVNGLGSKRFRLQGKVEGNLNRLRMDKDDDIPLDKENVALSSSISNSICHARRSDVKPVVGSKRSRYASLIDEEEESNQLKLGF